MVKEFGIYTPGRWFYEQVKNWDSEAYVHMFRKTSLQYARRRLGHPAYLSALRRLFPLGRANALGARDPVLALRSDSLRTETTRAGFGRRRPS